MKKTLRQRADEIEAAAKAAALASPVIEECFNCPNFVPSDEVLWGEKGEAYCSEACRDAVYGPEE